MVSSRQLLLSLPQAVFIFVMSQILVLHFTERNNIRDFGDMVDPIDMEDEVIKSPVADVGDEISNASHDNAMGSMIVTADDETPTTSVSDDKYRKSLPDLRNGGIVLFFHLPKTGGTSIRLLARKNDKIDLSKNHKLSMPQIKEKLEGWTHDPEITGTGRKVRMMEFHWGLDPCKL